MRYTPTECEVLALLNAPDITTQKGLRDKAMIELIYSSALRRREVSRLDIDHINLRERTVYVIESKFDKSRFIPMTLAASMSLMAYLEKSRPLYAARNPSAKALFLGEWGRRLSGLSINGIVTDYASLVNPRITTHSLRHATATHMLKRGANILYLQKLLGHSSPETTEIYTHLYPKDLIRIYKRLHPRA